MDKRDGPQAMISGAIPLRANNGGVLTPNVPGKHYSPGVRCNYCLASVSEQDVPRRSNGETRVRAGSLKT